MISKRRKTLGLLKGRKAFGMIFAVFLLLIPIAASATPIATSEDTDDDIVLKLTVTSGITSLGATTPYAYYTDYQAFVNYTDKEVELFCVEDEPAGVGTNVTYDLYKLDNSDLNTMRAAWIADNYWWRDSSQKGQAQQAIWYLLGVVDFINDDLSGSAKEIYSLAQGIGYFDTSKWLLAANEGRQDYLMRAPVPEPATLMMMGIGLLGVGLVTRRKIQK